MTQREIKFRAWIEEDKFLVPFGQLVAWHTQFLNFVQNDVLFEQYTGLKDIKGVEIYENDLVRNRDGEIGKVEYLGDGFSVIFNEFNTHKSTSVEGVYDVCEEVEVVGNIHENPGLLGK